MPCFLTRIKRLPLRLRQNLTIPISEDFERELMRELGVDTHEEMAKRIESMGDEAFLNIINAIINRMRKISRKTSEETTQKEVIYIT